MLKQLGSIIDAYCADRLEAKDLSSLAEDTSPMTRDEFVEATEGITYPQLAKLCHLSVDGLKNYTRAGAKIPADVASKVRRIRKLFEKLEAEPRPSARNPK